MKGPVGFGHGKATDFANGRKRENDIYCYYYSSDLATRQHKVRQIKVVSIVAFYGSGFFLEKDIVVDLFIY